MGANCHFSPTAQTPPWTKSATGQPSLAAPGAASAAISSVRETPGEIDVHDRAGCVGEADVARDGHARVERGALHRVGKALVLSHRADAVGDHLEHAGELVDKDLADLARATGASPRAWGRTRCPATIERGKDDGRVSEE